MPPRKPHPIKAHAEEDEVAAGVRIKLLLDKETIPPVLAGVASVPAVEDSADKTAGSNAPVFRARKPTRLPKAEDRMRRGRINSKRLTREPLSADSIPRPTRTKPIS